MEIYADKLIRIIKKKGWSIKSFCKEVNISRTTIYSWKKNKPKEKTIKEIAKKLKTKMSDFSDFKEKNDDFLEITNKINSFDFNKKNTEFDKIINFLKKEKIENNNFNIFMEAIFNAIESAIFIKDTELNYIIVNKNFKNILKLKGDYKIENKTNFDIYSQKEAKVLENQERLLLKSKTPIINVNCKLPGTRNKIDCSMSKYPILDSNKNIIGILGIYTDITEKLNLQNIENELTEIKSIFGLLLNEMDNNAFYIAKIFKDHSKSHFLLLSDGYAKITGYPKSKSYNDFDFFYSIVHPDDTNKFKSDLLNKSYKTHSTFRMKPKGKDKYIYVSSNNYSKIINNQEYAFGIMNNLSEVT